MVLGLQSNREAYVEGCLSVDAMLSGFASFDRMPAGQRRVSQPDKSQRALDRKRTCLLACSLQL